MESLLGIQVHRDGSRYGLRVTQHGLPMIRLEREECSRALFVDADRTIIVKVSDGQARAEAHTWANLNGLDRLFFATLLEVGPDYVVQEFVPMDKRDDDELERQARELCERNKCMVDFGWRQCGRDKRTGMLVIHDYCHDDWYRSPDTHRWTTLRIAEAA